MAYLFERRVIPALQELAEATAKKSRELLDALSKGRTCSVFTEMEKAGTLQIETIQAIDIENANALPVACRPTFPELHSAHRASKVMQMTIAMTQPKLLCRARLISGSLSERLHCALQAR